MFSTDISAGNHLLVRDAYGHPVRMRALSDVETKGHNFPIVWVERPLAGGGCDRVPWPVEAVRASVKEVQS